MHGSMNIKLVINKSPSELHKTISGFTEVCNKSISCKMQTCNWWRSPRHIKGERDGKIPITCKIWSFYSACWGLYSSVMLRCAACKSKVPC